VRKQKDSIKKEDAKSGEKVGRGVHDGSRGRGSLGKRGKVRNKVTPEPTRSLGDGNRGYGCKKAEQNGEKKQRQRSQKNRNRWNEREESLWQRNGRENKGRNI